MKGYVTRKGNRWCAVAYEGTDPVTGKERHSWHAAGPNRADAERLAARLASELEGRNDEVRGLTFGAFLTSRWLPGKRLVLAETTYIGYRRNVENHVLPTLGRIRLRRLRHHRGLVGVDYELRETRGKTPRSRRRIHLDTTTVGVLIAWRGWQRAEQTAAGIEHRRRGCPAGRGTWWRPPDGSYGQAVTAMVDGFSVPTVWRRVAASWGKVGTACSET